MEKELSTTQTIAISDKESNWQIAKDVTSNFVGSLSSQMFNYGLGLMLLDQTKLALSFGLSMIIAPIIGLLFLIPVGNITDRYPHKIILNLSISVRFAALIVFALTINSFHGLFKLIPVIIFLIINEISINFSNTSYSAAVHELVNENQIQKLNSLTQGAASFSAILAPALGVGLYSTVSFEVFIYLEILAAFISWLLLQTMHFHYAETNEGQSSPKPSPLADFQAGLKYVNQRKLIKTIISIAVIANFIFTAQTIGIPYIIKNQLQFGNGPVGFLDTGSAIGMLIGSILMLVIPDKKWFTQKILLPLLFLGIEIVCLACVFLKQLTALQLEIGGTIITLLLGITLAILNITMQVRLQKTIPTNILGRVMSLLTVANTSIMPLGTLFYTFLFQHNFNGGYILLINGLALFIYTILLSPVLLKNIKHDTQYSKD
ncbi:major facilitator superfamily transporter [Ligilactobacillus salitolerans]|uniref:Major facilitator superfamily transporter n=1 Tax=Ligilactobacillus salitolerans TaxID=1808352 RepID=A0A401IT49_9LACO|nr:MFS transporter [Ligilactobacillus salitolerans]GBG94720.1 major facilitator superfamily transporter [Ligilactobacillus salitolerans]